ncbi:MAG: hypothetical protein JNM75_02885 [Rhodospirillales bacterium]|nr:hypothetical protein [Rhodospirillales bacterium]
MPIFIVISLGWTGFGRPRTVAIRQTTVARAHEAIMPRARFSNKRKACVAGEGAIGEAL